MLPGTAGGLLYGETANAELAMGPSDVIECMQLKNKCNTFKCVHIERGFCFHYLVLSI